MLTRVQMTAGHMWSRICSVGVCICRDPFVGPSIEGIINGMIEVTFRD